MIDLSVLQSQLSWYTQRLNEEKRVGHLVYWCRRMQRTPITYEGPVVERCAISFRPERTFRSIDVRMNNCSTRAQPVEEKAGAAHF